MPLFEFKAKDKSGNIIEDLLYSSSKLTASTDLEKRGLDVISIDFKEEEVSKKRNRVFSFWISLQELARFTRYFAVLIKGNVPIIEAMNILREESRNSILLDMIEDVKHQVEGGTPLYMAFSRHSKHLPKIFIDLVKIGEMSGKLYDSFMRITDYIENTINFRRKLRDALTYPAILVFFIFVLVTYVVTLLVPRFEEIYKSLEGELPMPTQVLLAVGHFSRNYIWMIISGIIFIIILYSEINATRTGKRVIDKIKLFLPLYGMLTIQYNITHFVKSVSLMFFSGYTFINSLKESTNTVENIILSEELNKVCDRIENGSTINEAFRKNAYMPSFTVSMLKVGETSNSLHDMLDTIVNFNERELDYVTSTFLRLIEPIIIVTLAFIVGVVLFAAYLPILSMSRLIKV